MNDSQKTLHCLRCSPEGNLLFKKNLVGDTFRIFQRNVNCTFRAEPTSADLEEARSITQVEIAPNVYAVVNLRNGIPELPQTVASQYDVRKNPDGTWFTIHKSKQQKENQNETVKQNVAQEPVLEANAEGPPAVVKESEVTKEDHCQSRRDNYCPLIARPSCSFVFGACTERSECVVKIGFDLLRVSAVLISNLFVFCINFHHFFLPDSDQCLSAKISGEKVLIFSPCLRGGFGFWLWLPYSVD